MTYFGYHLMLDCSGCNDGIKSRANIHAFVTNLVKSIDMTAHGDPVIEYLLPGDPKQGYSLMQLITTSTITGHFIETNYSAYFDVFSCKEFDSDIVVRCVKEYFGAKNIRINYLTRHAD